MPSFLKTLTLAALALAGLAALSSPLPAQTAPAPASQGAVPPVVANRPAPPPPVDFGPLPEIHAAIPNTLPGLLGKPLKWVSTAPLVVPQHDETHFLFSVKDPTVAFINGTWEVYATANMVMGPQAAPLVQPGAARPARGGTFNMVT